MDRVRLGVLGAGNIAAMNVRGYLEDPRCDVVAVCDTDEEVGAPGRQGVGGETFYATWPTCWPTTPSTRSRC